jgi:hypothetical protein
MVLVQGLLALSVAVDGGVSVLCHVGVWSSSFAALVQARLCPFATAATCCSMLFF